MTDTTQPADWITVEAIEEICDSLADPDNYDLYCFLQTKYPNLLGTLQQRDKLNFQRLVGDVMQEVASFSSQMVVSSADDFFDMLENLYNHLVRPWLTKTAIGQVRQSLMKDQCKDDYDFLAEKEPEIITALQGEDVEAMKIAVNGLEKIEFKPNIDSALTLFTWLWKWAKWKKKLGYDSVVKTPRLVIDCTIEGVVTKAMIDTGAEVSFIKTKLVNKLKLPDYLWDRSVEFDISGVGVGQVGGVVQGVNVEVSDRRFSVDLYVSGGGSFDLTFGKDFLAFHQCHIHCEDYSIFFAEKKFWIDCWPSKKYWEYCRWRDFGLRKKREIPKQTTPTMGGGNQTAVSGGGQGWLGHQRRMAEESRLESWANPQLILDRISTSNRHRSIRDYLESQRPGLLAAIQWTIVDNDKRIYLVFQKLISDMRRTRYRSARTGKMRKPRIDSLQDLFAFLRLCRDGQAVMPSADSSFEWLTPKLIRSGRIMRRLTKYQRDLLHSQKPEIIRALELKFTDEMTDEERVELQKNSIIRIIRQLEDWYPFLKIDCQDDFFTWITQYIDYLVAKEPPLEIMPVVWGFLDSGRVPRIMLDTGADDCNLNLKLIEKCDLGNHQIDSDFSGYASGVGSVAVVGKIFGINISFKNDPMGRVDLSVMSNISRKYLQVLIGMNYLKANHAIFVCSDLLVYFREHRVICPFEEDPNPPDWSEDEDEDGDDGDEEEEDDKEEDEEEEDEEESEYEVEEGDEYYLYEQNQDHYQDQD